MHASDAREDARRALQVCNACRYCEGYCAVFPAMERRRVFSDGDLSFLANLCHNCRGCLYACQYAPPHAFGINLPRTFAELRGETYEQYAWPRFLGRAFRRQGLIAALAAAGSLALVLLLASLRLNDPAALVRASSASGAFYAVVPEWALLSVAGLTFGFALLALLIGTVRFWRATGGGRVPLTRPLWRALGDALALRYLGGNGNGCNDRDEGFSQTRRWLHHCLFYGFGLCFAATCVAALYEHVLDRVAPYPLWSAPVLLGTLGGAGMVVGTAGLAWVKATGDPTPLARKTVGGDVALLVLLFMTAATGLTLLAWRDTGAMGVLLAVHLGFVLALFLLMPYGKFVHGAYRVAALVRHAREAGDAPVH
ncbi:MAG: tricarballylate utilization 4Fe-4S protein TcuB [SAR324 cluster bacterium]